MHTALPRQTRDAGIDMSGRRDAGEATGPRLPNSADHATPCGSTRNADTDC